MKISTFANCQFTPSSPLLDFLMRMKKGNLLNYSFSSAFSLALEYDKETETILQADDSSSKVRLAEYSYNSRK